jgi:hypothetical protein
MDILEQRAHEITSELPMVWTTVEGKCPAPYFSGSIISAVLVPSG